VAGRAGYIGTVRVLLTVAYDGSHLAGWQRQAGVATVQEHLETAFAQLFGQHLHVEGAGRTDAGVHALRQRAHVDLPRPWQLPVLLKALNANLPAAVAVRSVREVAADFHARFDAVGKRYAYRFLCGPQRVVVMRQYFHWARCDLDVAAMRAAAAHLVGEHDFASFATNPGYPRKRGTVRRIDHLHVPAKRHRVDVVVQGNGFLYNMVRTIAGVLLEVGAGRRTPADVAAILAARDRRAAGATLAPGGLYLLRVLYRDDAFCREAETSEGARADE
jgi:tRNA pseudouridine38-40 synthase